MKKKLLPILTIAVMMFVGACSNDELVPEAKPERTISLTVNTPPENDSATETNATIKDDTPTTRVALNQDGKNIKLTWEEGDELKLAFVQTGKTTVNRTVPITNITNDGKRAKFEIAIPEDFDQALDFKLYGVYGKGALTGTTVTLPANAGSATSLKGTETTSVQKRKDVMLRFETDVAVANPNVAVTFQHLGSLFCITLTNNTGTALDNIQNVRLVGIDNSGNEDWAYNAATGGQSYDLVSKTFLNSESGGNYISFKTSGNSLAARSNISYWAWYPPLSDKTWPAIQLQLTDGTTIHKTSANSTKARTDATVAGKSFYFYAGWDGTDLTITREYTVDVGTMGSLSTLLTDELKKSIRKLTVKGQINKADFDVMKSNMPNLTTIDLSDAICYGNDGNINNKIPNNAFGGSNMANANQIITTVILPTTVTEIGDYAFSECRKYTGGLNGVFTLPAGLKVIGDYAFNQCRGLTGALTIPNEVTSIGFQGFYECEGFTGALTLSTKLETVKANAFRQCLYFSGPLTIPASVTTIKENAFLNCTKLTELIFEEKTSPNKLTIGSLAFQNCKDVVGVVTLPKDLSALGARAFCTCTKVTALRFTNETVFPYTTNMICKNSEDPAPHPVQVPTTLLEQYKAADGWKDLTDGTITDYK